MTDRPFREALRRRCVEAGLQLHVCSDKHLQIRGGRFIVNVYPTTGRIYIDGTNKGRRCESPREIVAAANAAPEIVEQPKRSRRKKYRAEKMELLQRDPFCWCCRARLNQYSATVDHVIPLARGGTNHPKNLRLACFTCNQKRGHDMPELRRKDGEDARGSTADGRCGALVGGALRPACALDVRRDNAAPEPAPAAQAGQGVSQSHPTRPARPPAMMLTVEELSCGGRFVGWYRDPEVQITTLVAQVKAVRECPLEAAYHAVRNARRRRQAWAEEERCVRANS